MSAAKIPHQENGLGLCKQSLAASTFKFQKLLFVSSVEGFWSECTALSTLGAFYDRRTTWGNQLDTSRVSL